MTSPAVSTPRTTVSVRSRRLCRPPKKSARPQHAEAPRAQTTASTPAGYWGGSAGTALGGGGVISTTVVTASWPAGPARRGSAPTVVATPSPASRTGFGRRGGAAGAEAAGAVRSLETG